MGKPKNFRYSQTSDLAHWRGSIDDLVVCPYDGSHWMKYCRLQIHILKCQRVFEKKHPNNDFVICNYNTLHRFPKDKLEEHLQKECKEYMVSVCSRVVAGKTPVVIRARAEDNDVHRSLLKESSDNPKSQFDAAYLAQWL